MRVQKSDVFLKWLNKLKDKIGKALINERISRIEDGNFGDCYSVGEDVFELRIHFGPGYRIYFLDTKKEIVILLCAGIKSAQKRDINKAKKIARFYKEK